MELKDIRFKDWSLSLRDPGSVVEGLADIAQCIAVIMVTQKGSDPFRPTFGVDLFKWIDSPVNVAGPNLVVEILEAIREWEPRVVVEKIEYTVEDAQIRFSVIWDFNGTQGRTLMLASKEGVALPGIDPPTRQLVADPTFSPDPGTFPGFVEVAISCETEDVVIYYTIDGTVPSGSSPVYAGPFVVNQDAVVRARAFRTGFIPSNVTAVSYGVPPYEAAILTLPGTYDGEVDIEIVSNDPGVPIYYTLDGSEPTAASTLYPGILTLVESAVVKAKAILAPGGSAPADSVAITIRSLAPSISPNSGTFETSRLITITNPNAAGSIYYTLDGSEPTTSSLLYSAPFTIEQSRTIRARVIAALNIPSAISEASVFIQVAEVTISPDGGSFNGSQIVTLETSTPGAVIYYTTNGTDPNESSLVYNPASKPNLTASTLVKARAFKSGCIPSDISEAQFALIQPFILAGVSSATAGQGRLYKSENNGVSWAEIQPLGNIDALWNESQISNDSTRIKLSCVVSGIGRYLYSNNGGASYLESTFAAPLQSAQQHLSIKSEKTGQYAICIANIGAAQSGVHLSSDYGATYSPLVIDGLLGDVWSGIAIDPDDRMIMYAFKRALNSSDSARIYKTTDGGANWSSIYSEVNRIITSPVIHGNAIFAGRQTSAAAYIGLLRSVDGGATFTTPTPLDSTMGVVNGMSQTGVLITGRQSGVSAYYVSNDYGNTWLTYFAPGTPIPRSISFNPAGTLCVIGGAAILLTGAAPFSSLTIRQPAGNVSRNWRLSGAS